MSVDSWLSELDVASSPPRSEIDDLREHLERSLHDAVEPVRDQLGADELPLRLPKGRLADLARCERSAVARAAGPQERPTGVAILGGVALDRFVAHQLVAGRVREPVADLTSMLAAAADHDTLAILDELDLAAAEELLGPLAAAAADSWADLDPQWTPSVESRATLVAAGGRVVSSGVVDVELGGGTRPRVLIEIKSGRVDPSHQTEVYLYALLVAMRDRAAPAVVARWYPGADPAGVAVGLGLLESAALRLVDGARRWAELVAGDRPSERPGGWCSWCPDRAECPSAVEEATSADADDVDPGGLDGW